MNATQSPRVKLRGIGAVLAGFVAIVILSLGTDMLLHAARVFPRWGQSMSDTLFLLATVYRTLYSVAGCYLAARLAPDHPTQHAMALGTIGLLVSIAGAVGTWNLGLGPHWYPLVLIALAMPCAWVGGRLRLMQLRVQPAL
jgi:hypothetical protein